MEGRDVRVIFTFSFESPNNGRSFYLSSEEGVLIYLVGKEDPLSSLLNYTL